MASRGQAITLGYYAYDTANSAGKAADVANHTIKVRKDGGSSASPTNAPAESDAANLPGWYQVALTAAECTCDTLVLGGKSSTSGIVISGSQVTFERLPTAAPAAAGGLLTVGTGAGQISPDGSGRVTAASVANLVGVLLDVGTVVASPAPTATTYSATGLLATREGAYVGSQHVFQTSSGLGHAHRVVTAHTITAGGTPVHNFTVTTPTGVTPVVGPAPDDTFLGG